MAVKQVLIVDDEPDIRELLELTLGRIFQLSDVYEYECSQVSLPLTRHHR